VLIPSEDCRVSEVAWNGTRQSRIAEVDSGEEGKVSELGSQGADQRQAGKRQARDARPVAAAAGDADPATVRRAGRPVAAEDPVGVRQPGFEGEEGREVAGGGCGIGIRCQRG
jgi:hypothetical protein